MKVTIEVELKPFEVPNYILTLSKPWSKQDGFIESPKYHLREIDAETLDKMCDDFRDGVFKKAGKPRWLDKGRKEE